MISKSFIFILSHKVIHICVCVCVYRQHECGKTNHLQTTVEDQDRTLNSLDMEALNLEPDEGEGYAGADSSVLRASKLTGNPNVLVERPVQHVSDRVEQPGFLTERIWLIVGPALSLVRRKSICCVNTQGW